MAEAACTQDTIRNNFIHKINEKGIRLRIRLDDGQMWAYVDPRTWGKWHLRSGTKPRDDSYFKTYGPDWITDRSQAMQALLGHKSRRRAKDVLTDQKVTAGLGNYLACETLWHAMIHPHCRWDQVKLDQRARLNVCIEDMIDHSLRRSDHGHWAVFQKKTCPSCGSTIKYVKDSGGKRGSYFCPSCQGGFDDTE